MAITFNKLTEGLKPIFVQNKGGVTTPELYVHYGRSKATFYYVDFPHSKADALIKGYHGNLGSKVPSERSEKLLAKYPELKNVKEYTIPYSSFVNDAKDLPAAKKNGDFDYQQDIIDGMVFRGYSVKISSMNESKEFPASAKVTAGEFLEPESYDKGVKKKIFGDEKVFDAKDTLDADLANDKVSKGNTDINKSETIVKEGQEDVHFVHKEEAFDLYDEIADLLENLDILSPTNYNWTNISSSLRSVRDMVLSSNPEISSTQTDTKISENEELEEAYKAGSLKLKDGSTVKVSKDDANALNKMLKSTSSKDDMNEDVTKDKKSFEEILVFAKSINEEFTLDEVSVDYLNKYINASSDSNDEAKEEAKKGNNNGTVNSKVKKYWEDRGDKRKNGIGLANKKKEEVKV